MTNPLADYHRAICLLFLLRVRAAEIPIADTTPLVSDAHFTTKSGHSASALQCPLWVVVSTGRRNTLAKSLCW
jgi:hypothetical protein